MVSNMRALVQKENGDLSTFAISEKPRPTPSEGEVLIRVYAASLNPVDIKRSDINVQGDSFPITVGYDVAGVIETSNSPDWAEGDRVFGDVMRESLSIKSAGSVAEFCVCPADLLARMPPNASFEECAALPVAACTAVEAFERVSLKEGEKVFVSAGAGGVGIHAMQVAKGMFGASEVATTASEAKIEFVKQYGADRVVDYKKENAGDVLKGWADVAMDCSGDVDMQLPIVKQGGRHISITTFDRPELNVSFFALSPTSKMINSVADLLKNGKLKAVIDTVYRLDDAMKALEHLAGGRAKGKVIIKVREA